MFAWPYLRRACAAGVMLLRWCGLLLLLLVVLVFRLRVGTVGGWVGHVPVPGATCGLVVVSHAALGCVVRGPSWWLHWLHWLPLGCCPHAAAGGSPAFLAR